MTASRRLCLYHRRGCHLCDDMLEQLELICRGKSVRIELVDIDSSPTLTAQYGYDIPVLTDGEQEICRHRLDRARLDLWLNAA